MKIFCIGLNKTGTRSLNDALEILGYRSLHWGGPDPAAALGRGPEIRVAVERALEERRPLLDDIDDVDAYSDILALSTNFDVLDRQYPGSRFILTVRDLDEWLDSRRRHVETNVERHARGEYGGTFLVVDYPGWTSERIEHEGRVREYFADRPNDLLVLDISAGDGWEVLCPFLDVPVPDVPFLGAVEETAMSQRVVLHVGTHKTGSTSLQHFLRADGAPILESVGASYPPGLALPTAHSELPLLTMRPERMWPARLRLPEVRDPAWLEAARRHLRGQVDPTTDGTLVYSHEDLSYARYDDELERLRALFDGAEVRIVVFLRDKHAFLRSYAAQLEATGFEPSSDPTSFAYVEPDSWLLDYDALLDGYRRWFGADNVAVLHYDDVVEADGSIIPAFLGLLGISRDSVPPHTAYVMNKTGANLRPSEEQLLQLRRRLAEQARS